MLNLKMMSQNTVPDLMKDRMNFDEWLFQRHCQVCFYNPAAETLNERQLIQCEKCHCAAHCSSPECAATFTTEHTSEACEKYMTGFASMVMSMQQGGQLVINTVTRATTLSLPINWADFFARKLKDFVVDEFLLRMPPVMVSRFGSSKES
jgi:hypothetical protein